MRRRSGLLPVLALLAAILGLLLWHIRTSLRSAGLNAQLVQAVANDDAAAAERLLRQGANPNAKASDFEVMWRSAPRRFLFNPANWPVVIDAYRSRLWEACPPLFFVKDPAVARALLAHGAHPDQEGRHGRTALVQSAGYGNATVVKALLAGGADPNRRTRYGMTALHHAAQALHPSNTPLQRCVADHHYRDVIEALLQAGADVNARTPNGQTTLTLAKRSGRARYVEMLKQAGAKE